MKYNNNFNYKKCLGQDIDSLIIEKIKKMNMKEIAKKLGLSEKAKNDILIKKVLERVKTTYKNVQK